jgi:hypothetical protein
VMTSHNENLTAAPGMASRLCRRAGRRIVQGRRHGRTGAAFETQRQLPASLRDFGRVWGGANQGLKPLALSLRPSGPETPATLQVQGRRPADLGAGRAMTGLRTRLFNLPIEAALDRQPSRMAVVGGPAARYRSVGGQELCFRPGGP